MIFSSCNEVLTASTKSLIRESTRAFSAVVSARPGASSDSLSDEEYDALMDAYDAQLDDVDSDWYDLDLDLDNEDDADLDDLAFDWDDEDDADFDCEELENA